MIPASPAAPPLTFPLFSFRRVGGLVLRHLFTLRGSWARLIELIYWPMMDVLVWGFISSFLATNSTWVAQATGVLLAAVLLWDVLFRGNLGVCVSFLEEIWSRNLGHLAVSPLTTMELAAALLTMSLIRTLIGMVPATFFAWALYGFDIYALGLPLLGYFVNLMITGWAFGYAVSALILRFGQGAESLAWTVIVIVVPLCGIYYPISTLPEWLQGVSWFLPPTHVFAGMRALLFEHTFSARELGITLGLNLILLALGVAMFAYVHRLARVRGLFIGMGE